MWDVLRRRRVGWRPHETGSAYLEKFLWIYIHMNANGAFFTTTFIQFTTWHSIWAIYLEYFAWERKPILSFVCINKWMSQENQILVLFFARKILSKRHIPSWKWISLRSVRFCRVCLVPTRTHTHTHTYMRTVCKRVNDGKQQIDRIFWTTIVIIINSVPKDTDRCMQTHMLAKYTHFELMMMLSIATDLSGHCEKIPSGNRFSLMWEREIFRIFFPYRASQSFVADIEKKKQRSHIWGELFGASISRFMQNRFENIFSFSSFNHKRT